MYGRVNMGKKYTPSTSEKIGIFLGALVALSLAELTDRSGMPQKWHAAIIGTVCPFTVVILIYRPKWKLWKFWASLVACLVVHLVAIWILFQYIWFNVQTLGFVYWFPIALLEGLFLVAAVRWIEERFTGPHETYRRV
jgi:hypothetical protein